MASKAEAQSMLDKWVEQGQVLARIANEVGPGLPAVEDALTGAANTFGSNAKGMRAAFEEHEALASDILRGVAYAFRVCANDLDDLANEE